MPAIASNPCVRRATHGLARRAKKATLFHGTGAEPGAPGRRPAGHASRGECSGMPALLFAPYAMRDLTLANRIVVSPMAQYSATPEGHATPWHLMHVGNLAVSGAGLVILEATAVEPRGRVSPRCLGLWNDAQAEALRPVLE